MQFEQSVQMLATEFNRQSHFFDSKTRSCKMERQNYVNVITSIVYSLSRKEDQIRKQ